MSRLSKNFTRSIFGRIERKPRTLEELAEETGQPSDLLFARLSRWCAEGRVVGRLIGYGPTGTPVIRYRLAEHRQEAV